MTGTVTLEQVRVRKKKPMKGKERRRLFLLILLSSAKWHAHLSYGLLHSRNTNVIVIFYLLFTSTTTVLLQW